MAVGFDGLILRPLLLFGTEMSGLLGRTLGFGLFVFTAFSGHQAHLAFNTTSLPLLRGIIPAFDGLEKIFLILGIPTEDCLWYNTSCIATIYGSGAGPV